MSLFSPNKNFWLLIILISVFLLGGVVGFTLALTQLSTEPIKGIVNQDNQELNNSELVDFSLFWDVWRILQQKYPKELNPQEMVYGAISGMVKSLNDPYTVFFKPDEATIFKEDVKGEFEGVGMEIGIRKNQLQVIAPLEGTPAQKAGLRSGDKIIKIDGKSTADITLDEAVKLIRGPKGTEVVLTILRDEWDEPKDISIIRDIIKIPNLKWELKEGNIAYVKLYHFSKKAKEDFDKLAIKILNSEAKAIILDLRDNPGGYLEVAQDISGWFLEKGEIVTIEKFAGGEQKFYKSKGPSKLSSYPIVVLINKGSASAAEILAGALRDNRKVKLIGEQSFGKGSIQEMVDLKDKSSLKVTIANWLTPKGDLITDVGLKPDIEVKMTEEDYSEGRDPQLDKAIEVIKEML